MCDTGPPALFGMKDSTKRPTVFSPWDLIHFLVGLAVCVTLRTLLGTCVDNGAIFLVAILIHSAYEFRDVQQRVVYKNCTNSLWDSMGDTMSFCVGFAVGLSIKPAPLSAALVWLPLAVLLPLFHKVLSKYFE